MLLLPKTDLRCPLQKPSTSRSRAPEWPGRGLRLAPSRSSDHIGLGTPLGERSFDTEAVSVFPRQAVPVWCFVLAVAASADTSASLDSYRLLLSSQPHCTHPTDQSHLWVPLRACARITSQLWAVSAPEGQKRRARGWRRVASKPRDRRLLDSSPCRGEIGAAAQGARSGTRLRPFRARGGSGTNPGLARCASPAPGFTLSPLRGAEHRQMGSYFFVDPKSPAGGGKRARSIPGKRASAFS